MKGNVQAGQMHFTGFRTVRCQITDEFGNVLQEVKKSFRDEHDVRRFIRKMKVDWLRKHTIKYIRHKFVLTDTGFPLFYRTNKRLKSVERCRILIDRLESCKDYGYMRKMINDHREDLRNILPSSKNPSYANQEKTIMRILRICAQ